MVFKRFGIFGAEDGGVHVHPLLLYLPNRLSYVAPFTPSAARLARDSYVPALKYIAPFPFSQVKTIPIIQYPLESVNNLHQQEDICIVLYSILHKQF